MVDQSKKYIVGYTNIVPPIDYNGDVEHDMWVDYDYHKNTGELDIFDEEDDDENVDELADWG